MQQEYRKSSKGLPIGDVIPIVYNHITIIETLNINMVSNFLKFFILVVFRLFNFY